MKMKPIHPFPARMAPELALHAASELPENALILDPMAGSGTVLRASAEAGRRAIGYDLDPLAVLMSRVWNTEIDTDKLLTSGYELLNRYDSMDKRKRVPLPWIDQDISTKAFIDGWFARKQRNDLRYFSFFLRRRRGAVADALRIVLSRLIIRKEGGASLGDDVSHSRPHRRKNKDNTFEVATEFEKSLRILSKTLREQPPPGLAQVRLGDGRLLPGLNSNSVDGIITSPPYLNAIDYMRGHKLALVWFGYQINTLSLIRSGSIGAERGIKTLDETLVRRVTECLGEITDLATAQRRMVERYTMDLHKILVSAHRVLRVGGSAVFVVGNSCLRGVFIKNSDALAEVARYVGFQMVDSTERALPAMRRYLPPPVANSTQQIEKRMRTEVVMRFRK